MYMHKFFLDFIYHKKCNKSNIYYNKYSSLCLSANELQIVITEDCEADFLTKTWPALCDCKLVYQHLSKPYLVKVPKWAPLTRQQYNEVVKSWPCCFHEDKV